MATHYFVPAFQFPSCWKHYFCLWGLMKSACCIVKYQMLEEGNIVGGEEAAFKLSNAALGTLSHKQLIQSYGGTGCGAKPLKNKKHIGEKSACKKHFQDAVSE